ncbi:MAG TPA: ABC transporter ATP-binding protein [Ilumatobacter sp.]|nr:ABC transporter ATP-binding protein [Ilumatobacter sp.]
MGDVALELDRITISAATEHGRLLVVDDLSLTLDRGSITGLVGESGSGKTVTALAATRLLPEPTLRLESGSIRLGTASLETMDAHELRAVRGARIAMVFQEPMTSLDPVFSVASLISEVLRSHAPITRRAARQEAIRLLNQVGIADAAQRVDQYPFQFSGGMRQRILIAMAMACEPEVLIADEPTTALDVTVQAQILELIRSIAVDRGVAVLLVTHDLAVVSEFCDQVAVMYAGQIVETGSTLDVLTAPAHPYTAALVASVPSATQRRVGLVPTIDGTVPALHEMPTGCRFAPRCRHATERCTEPVALQAAGVGRSNRCVRSDELTLVGVGRP